MYLSVQQCEALLSEYLADPSLQETCAPKCIEVAEIVDGRPLCSEGAVIVGIDDGLPSANQQRQLRWIANEINGIDEVIEHNGIEYEVVYKCHFYDILDTDRTDIVHQRTRKMSYPYYSMENELIYCNYTMFFHPTELELCYDYLVPAEYSTFDDYQRRIDDCRRILALDEQASHGQCVFVRFDGGHMQDMKVDYRQATRYSFDHRKREIGILVEKTERPLY